ncbi:MAG: hypothetical protein ACK4YP_27115 [Myxococcota bacterium]
MTVERVFVLSPARLDGVRARMLVRPEAAFELAVRLRDEGATLGEVMAFTSGLYFRGKLAYARAFARPPVGMEGVLVVTPCEGLVPADTRVGPADLARLGAVPVDPRDPRYADPLRRDLAALAGAHPTCPVVLLGSVATGKYLGPLAETLPGRVLVPRDFVGMGDMRRGSVLLRAVREGAELVYAPPETLLGGA